MALLVLTLTACTTLTLNSIGDIQGTGEVGETLQAGALDPAEATVAYQWQSCTNDSDCMDIAGATQSSYTLTSAEEGKWVQLTVNGADKTKGTLTTRFADKIMVKEVADQVPMATKVTITGTPKAGETLVATYVYSDSSSDLEGTTIFQWYSDTGTDNAYVAIKDANTLDYKVKATDAGHKLLIEVIPVALTGMSPGMAVRSVAILIEADSTTGLPSTQSVKKSPIIKEWPFLTDITYGSTMDDTTINGGEASVAGTFAFVDKLIVPDAGMAQIPMVFTPVDKSYASVTGNVALKVWKRNITVGGLSAEDKEYDGMDTVVVTGTAVLVGRINQDNVTLSGTPNFAFENAEVGADKRVFSAGFELSGPDADNYLMNQPVLSADITSAGFEDVIRFGWKYGSADWSMPDGYRFPAEGEFAMIEHVLLPEDYGRFDYYHSIAISAPSGCNCKWNGGWCGQPSIETMTLPGYPDAGGRCCGDFTQLHIGVKEDE